MFQEREHGFGTVPRNSKQESRWGFGSKQTWAAACAANA
jgi:hypothetical protein